MLPAGRYSASPRDRVTRFSSSEMTIPGSPGYSRASESAVTRDASVDNGASRVTRDTRVGTPEPLETSHSKTAGRAASDDSCASRSSGGCGCGSSVRASNSSRVPSKERTSSSGRNPHSASKRSLSA